MARKNHIEIFILKEVIFMSKATVHARIQLKNDTEANWSKANFIPLRGELIIYSADEAHPFFRLKVGDGTTLVSNLPFVDSSTVEGKSILVNTTANWRSQATFIPKSGDIVIYTDKTTLPNGTVVPGIKIGDGLAYGVDLPFVGDDIAYELTQHIADTVVHITAEERTFWNNKINCNDTVIEETLIIHRN